MGARLDHTSQGITLEASTPGAPGAQLTLFHNGRPLVVGQGRLKASDVTHPGVYRVEARLPGRQMPWIVSNPITVASPEISGGTPSGAEPDPAPEKSGEKLHLPMDASSWNIESDPTSEGSRRLDDGRLRFDYRLGDGVPAGQYAALVEDDRSGLGIDAIQFVGQASSPMRVSVQVRLPEGRGSTGQRWRRSVYLDATPRAVRLLLRDFEPADHPTARRPIVTPIGSLLFVVDTVNTRPGTSGTIWISDVTLGVSRLE
jgi:hypothetical protein